MSPVPSPPSDVALTEDGARRHGSLIPPVGSMPLSHFGRMGVQGLAWYTVLVNAIRITTATHATAEELKLLRGQLLLAINKVYKDNETLTFFSIVDDEPPEVVDRITTQWI